MPTPQILDGKQLRGGNAALCVDGARYLNFAGCAYLGLSQHPALRTAAQEALDANTGFSRFLVQDYGGQELEFDAVESEAAAFYGTEAAVYMPSGYHIGFAGIAAADPDTDIIVLDEFAHWCMQDAAKLSGKPIAHFKTGDVDDLSRVLRDIPSDARPLICTDGAFATSGIVPPLDKYAALAKQYSGWLMVDESHAGGAVGPTGRGAVEHYGVDDRAFVGVTLSKGFCANGSVFVGTKEQVARARLAMPLRGSNPGSPISAAVSAAALKVVRETPELPQKARAMAERMRGYLRALGHDIPDSTSSIMPLVIGDWQATRAVQQSLFDDGIYVMHSNYIAAGPGGLIRIAVFADHTEEDLKRLADGVAKALGVRGAV